MNKVQSVLEEELLKYQEAYYNGAPMVNDEEYDRLYDYFKKTFPDSELLKRIGIDKMDGFQKVKHKMIMGSQEKITSEKAFDDWYRLKKIEFPVALQHKLDGISIELQYEDGIFSKAVSRGDGDIGDDITFNVSKMSGIVKELKNKETVSVRGEILLFKSKFETIYKPQGYSNPRNMASGISKQKNGFGCENLNVIVYDCTGDFEEEKDKIKYLNDNGFEVAITAFAKDKKEMLTYLIKLEVLKDTGDLNLKYDIDGIVIKQNKIDKDDIFKLRPDKQRAWKFKSPEEVTKVIDIEWSYSGHIITPVAILEPVEISGSVVSRASLVNTDEIKRLELKIGDLVVVSKRNEIIPKIEYVQESIGYKEIHPPTECAHCNSKLVNDGKHLFCKEPMCPGKMYHRIGKWIDKLGINGFGPALLNDLFEKGFVNSPIDFYTMNLKKYLGTTNLVKATEKAFENLYSIKELPLETIISGYDIDGIGEKIIKLIVDKGFNTIEKISSMKVSDYTSIEGIGEDRAKKIIEGMEFIKNELVDLTDRFIRIKEMKEGILNEKSFCFTGKMDLPRKELEALVLKNGGIVKDSVTKDLMFLVNNDIHSMSSKNKKAISIGVKIIPESEFMRMIGV